MFVDEANHIYIAMPIYNFIEDSDNYSDTPGSLWQFKRDEAADDHADLSINNSKSIKYSAALVGKTADASDGNSFVKNTKIVVPLKYLSNFWRSLQMPLINCTTNLELNCIEDYILPSAGDYAKFKIMDAKLHAPTVTLSTKDNVNMTKELNYGFKIMDLSVFWNSHQTFLSSVLNQGTNMYEQVVKRLIVLAYTIAAGTGNNEAVIKDNKNFLRRGEINNYKVLIAGRNFYDQRINHLIKQYDYVRKVSTGKGDDYTTEYLLDYAYFKDNCRLIAVDLCKKKALDVDPKAIQQIVFQGVVGGANNTKIRLYTTLEKSKETV